MKKPFVFLTLLFFANSCDKICTASCLSSGTSENCANFCNCLESLSNELVSVDKQKLSECTWVYKDACMDAEDFDECIANAGCQNALNTDLIVKNIPSYNWEAINPQVLVVSQSIQKNIEKLNQLAKVEKFSLNEYLSPKEIIVKYLKEYLKNYQKSCYDQCETSIDVFQCSTGCQGFDIEKLNKDSMEGLKQLMKSAPEEESISNWVRNLVILALFLGFVRFIYPKLVKNQKIYDLSPSKVSYKLMI